MDCSQSQRVAPWFFLDISIGTISNWYSWSLITLHHLLDELLVWNTPLKANGWNLKMNENAPFEKGKHLNQTSILGSLSIFKGVTFLSWYFFLDHSGMFGASCPRLCLSQASLRLVHQQPEVAPHRLGRNVSSCWDGALALIQLNKLSCPS